MWLEPYPDVLLDRVITVPPGPEVRYQQAEAISLAFVTALQLLPARQRAVLILREVLGYRASEVASILDSSVASVNSALKRARANLRLGWAPALRKPPTPGSFAEQALVTKFVNAYQSGDVDALVALLTADVSVSMPPIPLEYHGREEVARFFAILMRRRSHHLVPARANGQPAFGAYLRARGGSRPGTGLFVLTLAGDQICGLIRFESGVLPWFGLPRALPA